MSLLIVRFTVRSESTHEARSPLEQAIVEPQRLHEILLGDDLEPRVLTDFRDALNRVRTAAWAAQQYVIRKETEQDSGSVLSLLVGERIRVTYQLCQTISDDLKRTDIRLSSRQPRSTTRGHQGPNRAARTRHQQTGMMLCSTACPAAAAIRVVGMEQACIMGIG
jgi:hypothetical protein